MFFSTEILKAFPTCFACYTGWFRRKYQ